MATTADDWTFIRSLLAITEEGNIAVDLVAQAVENLNVAISSIPTTDVDIVGQTGGNVDVDIKQSIEIATDIVAQTIGNLGVDIKASTIGNIPMNINEQGLGDILINLNAQNIDRVSIRDHDGGAESSSSLTKSCGKDAETVVHTVSGKGTLRSFFIYVGAQNGSDYIAPRIYIDDTLMNPALHFNEWSTHGADTNTKPFQLWKWSAAGLCVGMYWFEKGIIFDDNLSLRAYNHSAQYDVEADFYWFYQKIV